MKVFPVHMLPAADFSMEETTPRDVMKRAAQRALGGGIPGAAAMGFQGESFVWVTTPKDAADTLRVS
jgi:hypothetical protein